MNSIAESASFHTTGGRDAGRKRICRAFCAKSDRYCVAVAGVCDGLSDHDGVVATFFLIRYQSMVASRREINFARQFSSVSLVHRTETNLARQFFEVRPFIIAVQQNFRAESKSYGAK